MKPNEIMTWAGPLPPELIEANEGTERTTFALPPPAVMWAGPLPPGDSEIPRRRTRVFVIANRTHSPWAGAKA